MAWTWLHHRLGSRCGSEAACRWPVRFHIAPTASQSACLSFRLCRSCSITSRFVCCAASHVCLSLCDCELLGGPLHALISLCLCLCLSCKLDEDLNHGVLDFGVLAVYVCPNRCAFSLFCLLAVSCVSCVSPTLFHSLRAVSSLSLPNQLRGGDEPVCRRSCMAQQSQRLIPIKEQTNTHFFPHHAYVSSSVLACASARCRSSKKLSTRARTHTPKRSVAQSVCHNKHTGCDTASVTPTHTHIHTYTRLCHIIKPHGSVKDLGAGFLCVGRRGWRVPR
jgi:hypothetical protein